MEIWEGSLLESIESGPDGKVSGVVIRTPQGIERVATNFVFDGARSRSRTRSSR